jgi:hypothetical protein
MVVELSWFQVEDVENPHSGPTTASTTNSTFNYVRDIVRNPRRCVTLLAQPIEVNVLLVNA